MYLRKSKSDFHTSPLPIVPELDAVKLPSTRDRLDEFIVSVEWRRNAFVVVIPFFFWDLAITILVAKLLKEFTEDLFLRHLTWYEFRMRLAVIPMSNKVFDIDGAASSFVKLRKSIVNYSLPSWWKHTSNALQELIKVDVAWQIFVPFRNEKLNLSLSNIHPHFCETSVHFISVNLLVAVKWVKLLEFSSKSRNCSGTSSS